MKLPTLFHSPARRWLAAALVLAILAPAPAALAYFACSDTITVYASGGQTCERICRFYDNETGEYQGFIRREYRC